MHLQAERLPGTPAGMGWERSRLERCWWHLEQALHDSRPCPLSCPVGREGPPGSQGKDREAEGQAPITLQGPAGPSPPARGPGGSSPASTLRALQKCPQGPGSPHPLP